MPIERIQCIINISVPIAVLEIRALPKWLQISLSVKAEGFGRRAGFRRRKKVGKKMGKKVGEKEKWQHDDKMFLVSECGEEK